MTKVTMKCVLIFGLLTLAAVAFAGRSENRATLEALFAALSSNDRSQAAALFTPDFQYLPYGTQPLLQLAFQLPVPRSSFNATEYLTLLATLKAGSISEVALKGPLSLISPLLLQSCPTLP